MVTLSSRKIRNEIYDHRRTLKGKVGVKVYICENLTVAAAEIHREAMQLVKDKSLYICWTNGGCVFIKCAESDRPVLVHEHTSLIATC